MKRIALSTALRDWFLLGIIVTPFVLASFLLGKVKIVPLLAEFWGLARGDMGGIAPVTFAVSTIPTLIVFMVIGVAVGDAVNKGIAVTVGMPSYSKNLRRKMATSSLFVISIEWVIFTPIVEEIIFRGLFLWLIPHVWHGNTELFILVILSSLCFTAAHFSNYTKGKGFFLKGIPLFIVTFFLAFVFLKYGILAAFLVHATNNFFAILGIGLKRILGIKN